MKLIATDMDGTLLNEEGKISSENVRAIRKALDLDIKVVMATGRSYEAASKPLKEVGLTAPMICLNGANTYSEKKELIRKAPLDRTTAREVQQHCEQEGIYIELFTNEGVYSTSREQFIQVMIDILKTANPDMSEEEIRKDAQQRFQSEEVHFIDSHASLFIREDIEINKILAFSLDDKKLKDLFIKFNLNPGLAITSSGAVNLEFNHPDAQKGIALEELAKNMEIDMKDVMTLGDNFNDVSMLTMAGRGVAMGNAVEEIKALCKYTTKTNEDNGVAHAIEEMLKEM
ncbi:Cof-type HAD-IIB family hydrolase [Oceanobacillus manasiensis]|uniref:Cof-type HAD-IIB family hydrolase n=1 Tax=Oceanobacillus manasiensis TaxID=586413 RepID=UPI0005A7FB03|nr:Cof-type HAD-IIB family hydrolase [Oceanobacillus manasiensis]